MGYILFTEVIDDVCNYHNGTTSIVIGTFIIIAVVLSYLPQFWKIIKNKSTMGISYFYLLLGNISSYTNFFGTLLLNYQIIDCCSQTSAHHCLNIMLPLYQMFSPWLCIFTLYIIYLIYDDYGCDKEYKNAFISFTVFILVFVILMGMIGLGLIIHYQSMRTHINAYGNTLNIISAITCVLTFLPQIIKTYRLKKVGNLSLISLALQAPGSIIVFVYQNIIVKAPITIGFPYLVSGILQFVLLFLSLFYQKKRNTNILYPALVVNEFEIDNGY